MKIKFTDNQNLAIDSKGNILVSAAAGSGKTAVLVEHIIRKLTDPDSPVSADRLLVVTFTNAAAAEMRSRLEKRLDDVIRENPENTHLLRQKHLLSFADICTIDSFCINLVRNNFELCGIEPDFDVCEETKLFAERNAVLVDMIIRDFANGKEELKMLFNIFGGYYDEKNITKLIGTIYSVSMNQPFPDRYFDKLLESYNSPFEKGNIVFDEFICKIKSDIKTLKESSQNMLEVAPNCDKADKHIEFANELKSFADNCDTAFSISYDKLYELFCVFELKRLISGSDPFHNEFKFYFNAFKDAFTEIQGMTKYSYAELCENRKKSSAVAKYLISFVREYGEKVFELSKEKNIFSFAEVEQLARKLLFELKNGEICETEPAKALAEKYDEVLVDEYQDVNDLQDKLFYILSKRGKNLFVVGDIKQSIYGFRGSNPENFARKKKQSVKYVSGIAENPAYINLSDNYRSRDGICEFVNYVFGFLMQGQTGSLSYSEEDRLNPEAKFPDSNCVADVDCILVKNCSGRKETFSALQLEAYAIADYIDDIMKQENVVKVDNETARRVKYGDITILLSATKDKAEVIGEVLEKRGIPVSYPTKSFIDNPEIKITLSILRIINNPQSDIALLTAMMSPVFGFTPDELALIKANKRKSSLYSSLLISAENGNEKAQKFISVLSSFRKKAALVSLDVLLADVFEQTDLLNRLSAMEDGESKRANLFSLLDMAISFSSEKTATIPAFLKVVELQAEKMESVSKSGPDCVNITTMHKSKGLQYPVCILANLSKAFNDEESKIISLMSQKYGLSFKYADKNLKGHNPEYDLSLEKIRNNRVDESLRLLYVALTRAQDRLCLVSSINKNISDKVNYDLDVYSENGLVSPQFLYSKKSFQNWIIACLLKHPDCKELRDECDHDIKTFCTKSKVNLNIIDASDLSISQSGETDEISLKNSNNLRDSFNDVFSYEYPFDYLKYVGAKSSVSRLANKDESDFFAFKSKPAFMEQDGISAAGRGTAMHHIMQYISFDAKDIKQEIERLEEWQYISEAQAKSADINAIEKFFGSDIYKRITASSDVRREMRFLTEVSAREIYGDDIPENEKAKTIIQGAVDLCFDEGDGIVVLDFKTDRVKSVSELAERYAKQLEIYSAACEKIMGKKVKEKIIYSFALGCYTNI